MYRLYGISKLQLVNEAKQQNCKIVAYKKMEIKTI